MRIPKAGTTGLVLLSVLLPAGPVHAAAHRTGSPVEALSERAETSTTWVHGDGSLTTELTAGPIRFERDGRWVPVDTDLTARADGTVAPKAHPAGLTLAGEGGDIADSLAEARTAKPRDLATSSA
ncbi:hypothetical protein ACIGMX_21960 [Streptomyces aquilus]|uniref:hypothetical protein n=1 Tax=Streptomyces aquilus TaxID=2548456 RepID=UPI0010E04FDE|nr:hypothetical protein [Streptomyces aquilus]